jgi:lipopolysaccharide heptosyltransferase I
VPDPHRILIIKPSAIGDVVHALPVLNLLRRHWPAAKIDWLVTPACAGLLEGHPQLDEVVLFNRRHYGPGWYKPAIAWEFIRWTYQLRRRRYDLVIDLQGLFRSGWLAWATGAPRRIGFANAREGGWIFYTQRIHAGTVDQHAVERYLKLAQALGCSTGPIEFHLAVSDADHQAASVLLEGEEPFAVLLPGTNWPTKRWPIEHFAALVGPLRERFGLRAIVAGGPDESQLAQQIPGAVNLAGRTTLGQLTALLQRADLIIANDSGPMHIAAALGRPLVSLFGPTNPVRTGPFNRADSVLRINIACSPCYSRKCTHQSCLRWLSPDDVLRLAALQLEKTAALPLDNRTDS